MVIHGSIDRFANLLLPSFSPLSPLPSPQESVPIAFDSATLGPRYLFWHPCEPAMVVWVEALDGGDPEKDADENGYVCVCV